MASNWVALIESTGVPPKAVRQVLDGWYTPKRDRIPTLCRLLKGLEQEWPTKVEPFKRLRLGIYSPLQMLIWECGGATRRAVDYEYPFLFSLTGLLVQTLLFGFQAKTPSRPWPKSVRDRSRRYRMLIQSIFQLREAREEHEPLSLEVQLPLRNVPSIHLPIKKLAQVFGRGVGVTGGPNLACRENPEGCVENVFDAHATAPLASLYRLEPVFQHVGETDLRLVLRRDGHITLAAQRNPLLEFYDGGWHVVDIQSGRAALDLLLNARFPRESVPEDLAEYLIRLAYHLATHWHGAILAIVDGSDVEKDLEKPTRESDNMTKAIRDEMYKMGNSQRITDAGKSGFGRLLLSSAIQDGAVLFNPQGEFLSAGRIVKKIIGTPLTGGARRRAAKSLSQYGIVVAISQDGAIRLFSKPVGKPVVPPDGLRIH